MTITDVKTWYENSGLLEWKWFEGFDPEDLIRWIWERYDGAYDDSEGDAKFFDNCGYVYYASDALKQYIEDHEDDPILYNL